MTKEKCENLKLTKQEIGSKKMMKRYFQSIDIIVSVDRR